MSDKLAYVREKFAKEVGGEYSFIGGYRLGPLAMGQEHKVITKVGHWVVTLETVKRARYTSTRMSVSFAARHPFRFSVYRHNFLSILFAPLTRLLRLEDIEIGHPDFDHDFIVTGDSESSIRKLFADATLRSLLQSRTDLHLESDGNSLSFAIEGKRIDDLRLLRTVHDLLGETLRELRRLGFIR